MEIKTYKNLIKGVAIAQAIAAPALMVTGVVTNNKALTKAGMIWCGLVTLDTARTTWNAIDIIYKEYEESERKFTEENDRFWEEYEGIKLVKEEA